MARFLVYIGLSNGRTLLGSFRAETESDAILHAEHNAVLWHNGTRPHLWALSRELPGLDSETIPPVIIKTVAWRDPDKIAPNWPKPSGPIGYKVKPKHIKAWRLCRDIPNARMAFGHKQ
jgi:hypothetical protein